VLNVYEVLDARMDIGGLTTHQDCAGGGIAVPEAKLCCAVCLEGHEEQPRLATGRENLGMGDGVCWPLSRMHRSTCDQLMPAWPMAVEFVRGRLQGQRASFVEAV
jgi:hypothetical protein